MEKTESKLNKQISKYYVDHACQISSPGVVANELNLERSRVSDLRAGRRQLTVEQAEKIKEIYGLPSVSQGHWMECELISSASLHKQFIDNGLAVHFIKLIEMVSSDKFIDAIVQGTYVNEKQVPGYKCPLGLSSDIRPQTEQQNQRIVREQKLKLFNTLLHMEKFSQWCTAAIRIVKNHNGSMSSEFFENILHSKDILSAISRDGITHWDVPTTDYTRLIDIYDSVSVGLRFFIHTLESDMHVIEILHMFNRLCKLISSSTYSNLVSGSSVFSFGKKLCLDHKEIPVKEYVIVGKLVWEVDRNIRLSQPIVSESVVGWYSGEKYPHIFSEIMPPVLTHATFKLFYTEQYKYLLEVGLFKDEYDSRPERRLLIEVNNRHAIFDELMEVFDYFKVDYNFTLKEIKKSVALNGGYIPGAIYLD